jgi:hypothetical protein
VLGSAGFGELRRPGVGFANLGATSCPASVRLLWAGRFGASCEKVEELDNARPESAFRFQESESDGDGTSTEEVLVENASQGLFRMSNVIGDPDEPLTEEEKEKYTVKDHHGHKPHVEVASEIWSAKEQDGSNPFGDDSDKVHLREPNK